MKSKKAKGNYEYIITNGGDGTIYSEEEENLIHEERMTQFGLVNAVWQPQPDNPGPQSGEDKTYKMVIFRDGDPIFSMFVHLLTENTPDLTRRAGRRRRSAAARSRSDDIRVNDEIRVSDDIIYASLTEIHKFEYAYPVDDEHIFVKALILLRKSIYDSTNYPFEKRSSIKYSLDSEVGGFHFPISLITSGSDFDSPGVTARQRMSLYHNAGFRISSGQYVSPSFDMKSHECYNFEVNDSPANTDYVTISEKSETKRIHVSILKPTSEKGCWMVLAPNTTLIPRSFGFNLIVPPSIDPEVLKKIEDSSTDHFLFGLHGRLPTPETGTEFNFKCPSNVMVVTWTLDFTLGYPELSIWKAIIANINKHNSDFVSKLIKNWRPSHLSIPGDDENKVTETTAASLLLATLTLDRDIIFDELGSYSIGTLLTGKHRNNPSFQICSPARIGNSIVKPTVYLPGDEIVNYVMNFDKETSHLKPDNATPKSFIDADELTVPWAGIYQKSTNSWIPSETIKKTYKLGDNIENITSLKHLVGEDNSVPRVLHFFNCASRPGISDFAGMFPTQKGELNVDYDMFVKTQFVYKLPNEYRFDRNNNGVWLNRFLDLFVSLDAGAIVKSFKNVLRKRCGQLLITPHG